MKRQSENVRKKAKNERQDNDFLLVGLGASAGGIRALKEFFAVMPADSGMAFVVILHLSQEHKSNLAEILQRETAMKVEQVNGTVKVEPNRVYVIPPAKHLELVDGVIKLRAPERSKGLRVPIDRFLRSLADAYGKRAVSIILSGTGTDGTVGMKHVKGKDGFAIVQDPADAEYDGMPRSAIATNIADVVLPIAEMPEKLLFVRDTTEKFRLTDGHDGEVAKEIKNVEFLRDVLTLLRVRTGHDFSNYKRATLVRRVVRHLQIHETDDLEVYLQILRENPDEVRSLLKNLLINVTNFFRDKDAFNALEKKVIPNLFEGKTSTDQVRVWIAGCSTGEEAYSIAILLQEYAATLSDPPRIQVFASDVDEDAITDAREGRFTEAVVSDVPPEKLRTHFVKVENGYRVRKQLRQMILFAPHNILRDPPFSRIDLISCRNVMIYLNRETQEKVFQVFHFALRERGYLFLGSSESAESTANNFSAVDKKHRIYQSRPSSAAWSSPPPMPQPGPWSPKLFDAVAKTRNHLQSFGELHHRLIEQYAPPSVLVNEDGDILHLSENAGRFLRFVGGTPSSNLLKLINPALLTDVRAALVTARKENKAVEAKNIRVNFDGEERFVNLTVRPAATPEAAALVMFEETEDVVKMEASVQAIVAGDKALESVMQGMEDELRHAKDQLRNTIDQYETSNEEQKAANEELQAINEELRSASEELETSKEELQSVNEELTTVNQELKEKVEQINRANSDLQNLMHSTDIGTIFLDRELQIKRYTPRATEIFNLLPADIGRPLAHITHRLQPDTFEEDAGQSLLNLQTFERDVRSTDGRFFIARFSPYRTLEDKIEGVVISFINVTAREEAETLVRQERAYAEGIVETVREPLIVLDKDLRVVSASRSFYDIFRVLPEETEGEFIYGLGNGQWDIPELRELLEDVLPRNSSFNDFEVEHDFLTIGPRVMLLNGREIRRGDGARRLILLAIDDITGQRHAALERARAEEALTESEIRFHMLADNMAQLAWTCDKLGNVTWYNKRWLDYTGMSFEDMKGWDWSKVQHPDHLERVVTGVNRSAETGEPWEDIFPLRGRDGKYRWFLSRAIPIRNDEGAIFCWFGTNTDITESREVEQALRDSEQRLSLLSESFHDFAIFTMDVEGNVVTWNPGAELIFGYGDDEILGHHASLLFVPEDRANRVPEKEMETAQKKGRAADERWHLRKDGSRFYASGIMAPLRDGDKLIGFAKIARDLTHQKQTEQELLQHRETLEQLIAGRTAELAEANEILKMQMNELRRAEEERIALLQRVVTVQEDERRRVARDMHDSLGQQLTALRLKLESLKNGYNKGGIVEGIEGLQELGKRLDEEVNFLVWQLRPTVLDDLGLAAAIENYVREWSRYSGIEAEFHAGRLGSERVEGTVETNLYRITQEALNNTSKHAGAKNANIVLETRKSELVLVIEDDGRGFDIEELKNTPRSSGGLGLKGMRERAAIIGGILEIESSPGNGTTVFVRVPLLMRT